MDHSLRAEGPLWTTYGITICAYKRNRIINKPRKRLSFEVEDFKYTLYKNPLVINGKKLSSLCPPKNQIDEKKLTFK